MEGVLEVYGCALRRIHAGGRGSPITRGSPSWSRIRARPGARDEASIAPAGLRALIATIRRIRAASDGAAAGSRALAPIRTLPYAKGTGASKPRNTGFSL